MKKIFYFFVLWYFKCDKVVYFLIVGLREWNFGNRGVLGKFEDNYLEFRLRLEWINYKVRNIIFKVEN